MIREDLALLNVHHEVFFSERTLHADNARQIRKAISDLTIKGHIYKGKLPPPKGEKPDDWEDREQTLFRSTEVGDDIDRPLVKSDGHFTYFAADVGYLYDKVGRGFDELIFVLGADHGGYVKRWKRWPGPSPRARSSSPSCSASWSSSTAAASRCGCRSVPASSSRCVKWSRRSGVTRSAS